MVCCSVDWISMTIQSIPTSRSLNLSNLKVKLPMAITNFLLSSRSCILELQHCSRCHLSMSLAKQYCLVLLTC